MDLSFSKEDLDFRQDVVNFLDAKYPEDIRERQDKRLPLDKEQNVRWQKILSKKGWFAVNWPSEYSGSPELSLTQKYILQKIEERIVNINLRYEKKMNLLGDQLDWINFELEKQLSCF